MMGMDIRTWCKCSARVFCSDLSMLSFYTDEATLAALIQSNKASTLRVQFNKEIYVVSRATMCICSRLVRELVSDIALGDCIELHQKYVSTDVFEMLLPYFNSGFLSTELMWDSNTIMEALLLSDYLQADALCDLATDAIIKEKCFNGSLFHHTTVPLRMFEGLLTKAGTHQNRDEIVPHMWKQYTLQGFNPSNIEMPFGVDYYDELGDPFDPCNGANWDGDQQVGFRD